MGRARISAGNAIHGGSTTAGSVSRAAPAPLTAAASLTSAPSPAAFLALLMWSWTCRVWQQFTDAERALQLAANAVSTAVLATALALPQQYRRWRPVAVFVSRVTILSAPSSCFVISKSIAGEAEALLGTAALGASAVAAAFPVGPLTLIFFATRALGVYVMALDNDLDVGPALAAQLALAALSRQCDGVLCHSPLAEAHGMLPLLRACHFFFYGALAPEGIESPGTSLLALCFAVKAVLTALPVVVAARRQTARDAWLSADQRRRVKPSAAAARISEAVGAVWARPLQGVLLSLLGLQLLWAACYATARRSCALP